MEIQQLRKRFWSWNLYLKKLQTQPQCAIRDTKIAIAVSTINNISRHAAAIREAQS